MHIWNKSYQIWTFWIIQGVFRHASVSNTYPCPLVGWLVTLSNFQSLVRKGKEWKVKGEKWKVKNEKWKAKSEKVKSERWKVVRLRRLCARLRRLCAGLRRLCARLHRLSARLRSSGGNVFFKVHFSEVFLSKVHFCEMYPTCVSSKLCELIQTNS